MSIESVVAGAYTGAYNAVNVGFTRNGYKTSRQNHQELINQSDLYGDTIIDTVYRGGDTFLDFICRVFRRPGDPNPNAVAIDSITPFWPFGTDINELWAAATPLARLGSSFQFSMVLTAVANTPAAASPATLTAPNAILAPGFNGEILFDSRARDVPIRLLCLPTAKGVGVSLSRQAGNIAHITDDGAWWLQVTGSLTPAAWDNATAYIVGNLVTDDADTYICVQNNVNQEPPNATYWLAVTLQDQGAWSVGATYAVGDYVVDDQGISFFMT